MQRHSFQRVPLRIQEKQPGIEKDDTGQQKNQWSFKNRSKNLSYGWNEEQKKPACHHYTEQGTGEQEAGDQQGSQYYG